MLVLLIDEQKIYPELSHEIYNAANQYGFTYVECDKSTQIDDSILSGYKIRHAIIFDGVDDPNLVTSKYLSSLEKLTSMTLAISYSNETSFRMASLIIEKLKKEHGHKINYLRPTYEEGKLIPSLDKLIDNSICDSVRIKYRANHRSNKLGDSLTHSISINNKRGQYPFLVTKIINYSHAT